ncbi:MAG: hypothetical protein LUE29_00965 [Lachnospiraceae bacterium]|nr:hypothetical protein [Lachnospiraceae bacterium]
MRKNRYDLKIKKKEKTDPFYSEENMLRLERSIAQMEAAGSVVNPAEMDDESKVAQRFSC